MGADCGDLGRGEEAGQHVVRVLHRAGSPVTHELVESFFGRDDGARVCEGERGVLGAPTRLDLGVA